MSLPEGESSDHLLGAISECVDGMITGFVVIAAFQDVEGERRIYCDTLQDQRCHETLGMLEFASAVERYRAVEVWREE